MNIWSEILIQTISSTLIGASTGALLIQVGFRHYKRTIAAIGDDNGSIKINGRWYVIKREGL